MDEYEEPPRQRYSAQIYREGNICPIPKCLGKLEFLGIAEMKSTVSAYMVFHKCNHCRNETHDAADTLDGRVELLDPISTNK